MNYERHRWLFNCGCKICSGTFTLVDMEAILGRKERRRAMAKAVAAPRLVEVMDMPPVLHPPGSFGEVLE
jgi:hypothetical protein